MGTGVGPGMGQSGGGRRRVRGSISGRRDTGISNATVGNSNQCGDYISSVSLSLSTTDVPFRAFSGTNARPGIDRQIGLPGTRTAADNSAVPLGYALKMHQDVHVLTYLPCYANLSTIFTTIALASIENVLTTPLRYF